jgi:hypothetical protein
MARHDATLSLGQRYQFLSPVMDSHSLIASGYLQRRRRSERSSKSRSPPLWSPPQSCLCRSATAPGESFTAHQRVRPAWPRSDNGSAGQSSRTPQARRECCGSPRARSPSMLPKTSLNDMATCPNRPTGPNVGGAGAESDRKNQPTSGVRNL